MPSGIADTHRTPPHLELGYLFALGYNGKIEAAKISFAHLDLNTKFPDRHYLSSTGTIDVKGPNTDNCYPSRQLKNAYELEICKIYQQ
jgi:hypothetical protein